MSLTIKIITLLLSVLTYIYLSIWIYRYINSYCGVMLIAIGILWIFHRMLRV